MSTEFYTLLNKSPICLTSDWSHNLRHRHSSDSLVIHLFVAFSVCLILPCHWIMLKVVCLLRYTTVSCYLQITSMSCFVLVSTKFYSAVAPMPSDIFDRSHNVLFPPRLFIYLSYPLVSHLSPGIVDVIYQHTTLWSAPDWIGVSKHKQHAAFWPSTPIFSPYSWLDACPARWNSPFHCHLCLRSWVLRFGHVSLPFPT